MILIFILKRIEKPSYMSNCKLLNWRKHRNLPNLFSKWMGKNYRRFWRWNTKDRIQLLPRPSVLLVGPLGMLSFCGTTNGKIIIITLYLHQLKNIFHRAGKHNNFSYRYLQVSLLMVVKSSYTATIASIYLTIVYVVLGSATVRSYDSMPDPLNHLT